MNPESGSRLVHAACPILDGVLKNAVKYLQTCILHTYFTEIILE